MSSPAPSQPLYRAALVAAALVRLAAALMPPFVEAVWQIFGLIFILQAASAVFTPVFQATIRTSWKTRRPNTNALSLSRLAYGLEALLSPALAAVLLLVVSFPWLFDGAALGFLTSAILVFSLKLPGGQPKNDGTVAARLKALMPVNLAVAAAGGARPTASAGTLV